MDKKWIEKKFKEIFERKEHFPDIKTLSEKIAYEIFRKNFSLRIRNRGRKNVRI